MERHYKTIQSPSSVTALATEIRFDADTWLKWFQHYCNKGNAGKSIKAMRQVISRGTIDYCQRKSFPILPTLQWYRFQDDAAALLSPSVSVILDTPTVFEVLNSDCLDAELVAKTNGFSPCVLNMTSRARFGGGWQEGAGAQEESLFRRSNFFAALLPDQQKEYYPLDDLTCFYTPDVTVFRASEAQGYAFLDKPRQVAFMGVSAIKDPVLDGEELSAAALVRTRNKIRALCTMAILHGHDCLILGAFGCGAYRNPPRSVAHAFRQVMQDEAMFKNRFKSVIFAILDDHNAHLGHNPEGNFKPFLEEFVRNE